MSLMRAYELGALRVITKADTHGPRTHTASIRDRGNNNSGDCMYLHARVRSGPLAVPTAVTYPPCKHVRTCIHCTQQGVGYLGF